MWPTWGPSGADRTQVGSMLAQWTLLSGRACILYWLGMIDIIQAHDLVPQCQWSTPEGQLNRMNLLMITDKSSASVHVKLAFLLMEGFPSWDHLIFMMGKPYCWKQWLYMEKSPPGLITRLPINVMLGGAWNSLRFSYLRFAPPSSHVCRRPSGRLDTYSFKWACSSAFQTCSSECCVKGSRFIRREPENITGSWRNRVKSWHGNTFCITQGWF